MFVKITRGHHSGLYECDELRVENSEKALLLTMERYGCADPVRVIEVDRDGKDVGVYAMNDQGKTVDVIFTSA